MRYIRAGWQRHARLVYSEAKQWHEHRLRNVAWRVWNGVLDCPKDLPQNIEVFVQRVPWEMRAMSASMNTLKIAAALGQEGRLGILQQHRKIATRHAAHVLERGAFSRWQVLSQRLQSDAKILLDASQVWFLSAMANVLAQLEHFAKQAPVALGARRTSRDLAWIIQWHWRAAQYRVVMRQWQHRNNQAILHLKTAQLGKQHYHQHRIQGVLTRLTRLTLSSSAAQKVSQAWCRGRLRHSIRLWQYMVSRENCEKGHKAVKQNKLLPYEFHLQKTIFWRWRVAFRWSQRGKNTNLEKQTRIGECKEVCQKQAGGIVQRTTDASGVLLHCPCVVMVPLLCTKALRNALLCLKSYCCRQKWFVSICNAYQTRSMLLVMNAFAAHAASCRRQKKANDVAVTTQLYFAWRILKGRYLVSPLAPY